MPGFLRLDFCAGREVGPQKVGGAKKFLLHTPPEIRARQGAERVMW